MLRFLLLLLCWPVAYGCEFCALRIVAGNDRNHPEKDALVELEAKGKVVASVRTDENGEAAFCDFGLDEHLVRVRARCNDIVIMERLRGSIECNRVMCEGGRGIVSVRRHLASERFAGVHPNKPFPHSGRRQFSIPRISSCRALERFDSAGIHVFPGGRN